MLSMQRSHCLLQLRCRVNALSHTHKNYEDRGAFSFCKQATEGYMEL